MNIWIRIGLGLSLLLSIVACEAMVLAEPSIPQTRIQANWPPNLRHTIGELYSKHPTTRLLAINNLASMKEAAAPATPFLIALADDVALVQVKDMTVLGRHDVIIADAAVQALIMIGREAVPNLVEALQQHTDADERALAAEALARICVLPPEKKAKTGQYLNRKIVDVWLKACSDDDARVKRRACAVLRQIEIEKPIESYLQDLNSPDPKTRKRAAKLMGRIRITEAVPGLMGMLQEWEAREALGHIGGPAVKPLIEALATDKSPGEHAGWALHNMRSHEAVMEMLAQHEHVDPRVRKWIADAMAGNTDPDALPVLLKYLTTDSNTEVRKTAAWTLGHYETVDKNVLDALRTAQQSDKEAGVRKFAAWSLDRLTKRVAHEKK